MATQIPAIKIALQQLIITAINDTEIPVTRGTPHSFLPLRLVYLGRVTAHRDPFETIGSGGLGWLEEAPRYDIVIRAWSGDVECEAAEDESYRLLGLIESAIRADLSLGGLSVVAIPAAVDQVPNFVLDENGRTKGTESVITLGVDVTAIT